MRCSAGCPPSSCRRWTRCPPARTSSASPRTAEVDLAAVRAATSQGAPSPPDYGEGPGEDADERTRLFAQVRAHPLDPDAYQRLADYFDTPGDLDRGDLMAEIAGALEGVPEAPARVPKLILSASDRAAFATRCSATRPASS